MERHFRLFQETVVFVVRLKGLCGLSLGVEAGGRRSDDGRDGWRAETTAGHGSGVGKRKTAGIPGRIGWRVDLRDSLILSEFYMRNKEFKTDLVCKSPHHIGGFAGETVVAGDWRRQIIARSAGTDSNGDVTFLTASVREASEAPRNFPRAGETGTDFRIPFLGAAAVAGEVDEVELFAAAIRTRQASPKIRVDGAIFPILSKNPRERERGFQERVEC
nr:hypothetical protein Iba_chr13aCG6850 [Ipomoea batatas]